MTDNILKWHQKLTIYIYGIISRTRACTLSTSLLIWNNESSDIKMFHRVVKLFNRDIVKVNFLNSPSDKNAAITCQAIQIF